MADDIAIAAPYSSKMDDTSSGVERGPFVIDAADDGARMPAGLSTRQLIIVTACFWMAEFTLAELRSVVDHSAKLELYTFLRMLSAGFGCVEFFLIHLFARRTAGTGLKLRGVAIVALAALAGFVNLKTIDALQNLSSFPVSDYGLGWRIYNATYWALMFMAWAAIYLALDYNAEAVEQERKARLLEQMAHDAQLRALRFQIDPHFLFNTLNSVSALILEERSTDAEEMIAKLADFFRTTLVTNPRQDVTLGEEIALQRIYLEIEKVRFPNLSVDVELHPDAADAKIPPLLLQPIVENAVKFAVSTKKESPRMGITIGRPVSGIVRIVIWDDGPGTKAKGPKGTGTGLANVRDRLQARFGGSAAIELREREPQGAEVQVTIPSRLNGSGNN